MDRNSMTIWNKVTGEWIDKNGPEKLQTQVKKCKKLIQIKHFLIILFFRYTFILTTN